MTNHPNRGWRSRWSVDLEMATATHRDGWAFQFSPVAGESGVFDGRCIRQPDQLADPQAQNAVRIAREAGDIYIEAREGRQ